MPMNLLSRCTVPATFFFALLTFAANSQDAAPAVKAADKGAEADKGGDKTPAPKEEAKAAKDFRPFQLLKDGRGAPAVARALTETFMTDEEFKAEVEKVRARFADFEKDTQRDIGHYLNDRLVIHGLAAANGKIEKIKKGLIWLSMYGEFQQQPPAFVETFIKNNIDSLTALFQDFNWDRASNYIKNREWRKNAKDEDGEDKKTASVE
jgi:hypothetical protein